MTNRVQDTVFGVVLVVLATAWTWLVVDTIRPGMGDGDIGARAFPLTFGLLLLVLSTLLLLKLALGATAPDDEEDETGEAEAGVDNVPMNWLSLSLVLAQIVLYGYLLEKIGFLLATPTVILLAMIVSLRVRSLPKLVGMCLGLTLGCWLLFEKILGIPLANGVWVSLG